MEYRDYKVGQQPCGNFTTVNEEWFGVVRHVCPDCCGFRIWCKACSRDHHQGGWETCTRTKASYTEVDPMDKACGDDDATRLECGGA